MKVYDGHESEFISDTIFSIIGAFVLLILIWFRGVGFIGNVESKDRDDKELFKQPPPDDDCPICFVRLPNVHTGYRYRSCCGKVLCCGCIHAPVYDSQGNKVDNQICPFCRTPTPDTEEESIEREEKRMEKDDAIAIYNKGMDCMEGSRGYPQDYTKALEYWHRAADLGYTKALCCIGCAYEGGDGVGRDDKKAKYYYEMAAMQGDATARYNLGLSERRSGNIDRFLKHNMIAVKGGDNDALKEIKECYTYGIATKEDYTKALQAYQAYLGEIKSPQRDKAAAADAMYRYY